MLDIKKNGLGNFTVGDGNIHEGFKSARDEVLRFVKKYINEKNINGNLKIWTAGHSRGAAIANMIGGFFIGGGIEYFGDKISITPEDVYCYTYATPRTIKDGLDKNIELSVSANRVDDKYTNDTPGETFNYTKGGKIDLNNEIYNGIRNFISPNDIFPLLPPEKWGFACYGKNISINHDKVTEEDMLAELKKISEYAYQKYKNGGNPNSFERKTFDLKTLNIVKDNGKYSAMDMYSFLKERMNSLTYNAATNKQYKDKNYQEALKSVAGTYGMSMTLFDNELIKDISITSPLVYSYLAYASERLQEEKRANSETQAVAIVIEDLLSYYTKEEINNETFSIDNFVTLLAKYISENEKEPITDTVISGIINLIPEKYSFILNSFKQFDKNNKNDNGVTAEEGLKAYFKACYYGTDPESESAEYYTTPSEVRGILYALVSFALMSDYPEIGPLLMDENYNPNGHGKFEDFIGVIFNILKTSKDENGNIVKTYKNLSEAADDTLKKEVDKLSEKILEKAQKIYGSDYKDKLNIHIQNIKKYIPEIRKLLLYGLLYEDGKFNVENNIKNITTFIGNMSILPLAHYNEIYLAYAKAAEKYDCGYENHYANKTSTDEGNVPASSTENGNEEANIDKENTEKIENENIEEQNNPKTGDNIVMWISIMIVSIIGIVVIVIAKKKRYKKSL